MSEGAKKFVKDITSMKVDFAKWYTDIVVRAELIDYSSVRGCVVLRPYGFSIWENITRILDKKFKEISVENVSMPLLIPESLLQREKDHIEGFAPEVAWVTHGGSEELSERLCIRPTSEVLFCSHFRNVIHSWRDLPKLYNQWCSVVRWEKTSRPFLRSVEFHWQEGHTMHSSSDEARSFTLKMLNVYFDFIKNNLLIPSILGRKTESEKFAGAEETYTIECMMKDGKALQSATSHYFGNGFANTFDIKFTNKNNELEAPYQTSWGLSTRIIASIIMTHGDDDGLVLPPDIAPIQVVVVPVVLNNERVKSEAVRVSKILSDKFRAKVDLSDQTAGWKFSYYEMKGVPVRVEIGPRDLESESCVIVRRDNREKEVCKLSNVVDSVGSVLEKVKKNMYDSSLKFMNSNILNVSSISDIDDFSGFVMMPFCESDECESLMKEKFCMSARCIPFDGGASDVPCAVCGKKSSHKVYFAKAY